MYEKELKIQGGEDHLCRRKTVCSNLIQEREEWNEGSVTST